MIYDFAKRTFIKEFAFIKSAFISKSKYKLKYNETAKFSLYQFCNRN